MVFPVNDPRFCYAYRVKTLLSEGAKFSGEPDRDAGKTESISPNGIANFGKTVPAPEVGDGKGGFPDSKKFRAMLVKIMPGYDWTIHRASKGATSLVATGTQSSGFNRLSTLEVMWKVEQTGGWFVARSSGYGLRSRWLAQNGDVTLAKALRGLQEIYAHKAHTYRQHELALKNARSVKPTPDPLPQQDTLYDQT